MNNPKNIPWHILNLSSVLKEKNQANWRLTSTKFYSSTRYEINVNGNDWHILVGNKEKIESNCLNQIPSQDTKQILSLPNLIPNKRTQ